MDKILRALYSGKIFPQEQYRPIIEEYKSLRKRQYEHYKDFINKIGSPLDKEFEHIMDEQIDLLPLEFSQMFIDGFRLGARMMLEVLEDKYEKK